QHTIGAWAGLPSYPALRERDAGGDLVVAGRGGDARAAVGLPGAFPGLVLLSTTPGGTRGPYAGRPESDLVIQAECGSIGTRGLPGGEPFQAGGRTAEWLGGVFAALGALAAVRRARASGHGEHVDFSLLEGMNIAASNYVGLLWGPLGRPPPQGAPHGGETASIQPTARR